MKAECKLFCSGVYVDIISRVYLRQQLRRNPQTSTFQHFSVRKVTDFILMGVDVVKWGN